jgi:hypothetical protein
MAMAQLAIGPLAMAQLVMGPLAMGPLAMGPLAMAQQVMGLCYLGSTPSQAWRRLSRGISSLRNHGLGQRF